METNKLLEAIKNSSPRLDQKFQSNEQLFLDSLFTWLQCTTGLLRVNPAQVWEKS